MMDSLDLRKIPEHKFGFASLNSLKKLYIRLNQLYPELIAALEQKNIEKFTTLLANYASSFIRCLARDQKYRWQFIDAYQSIALKFVEHFLHEQGIMTENLHHWLSEAAIIEYGRLCNLCIDLFADYQEMINPSVDELVEFSRLLVLRPFILNLFPINPDTLTELHHRSIDFKLENRRRVHFKDSMQHHVLMKNDNDQALLQELALVFLRLKNHYSYQHNCWYRCVYLVFMQDPLVKMNQFHWLYLIATGKQCSLGDLTRAIDITLLHQTIRQHRCRLRRLLGGLFLQAPPKAVKELMAIRSRLTQSRIFPEVIAQRISQPD